MPRLGRGQPIPPHILGGPYFTATTVVDATTQPCWGGVNQRVGNRRSTRAVVGNNQSAADGNAVSYVLQTPAVGGNFISQRRYSQRSRAVVGNNQSCADGVQGQPKAPPLDLVSVFVIIPRKPTQRTRAHVGPFGGVSGSVYGFLQPHGPPSQIPSSAVPPRRKSTRAVVAHNAGPVRGSLPYIQPRATVAVPRRYRARGIYRSGFGLVAPTSSVQPRATVPVPRRTRARAGLWHANTGSVAPLPYTQPRGSFTVAPRRAQSRAGQWRAGYGANTTIVIPTPNGSIQPAPTRQPRRTAARAFVKGITPPNPVPVISAGTVQSRASVPVPRRYRVRAGLWRWNGGPQPHVKGQVQSRATVPVPRRYRTRAGLWFWNDGTVRPTQSVQPRATVPVPRRVRVRAGLWRTTYIGGGIAPPNPNGKIQPRATIAIPRRLHVRSGQFLIGHGTVAPPSPAGKVQSRATIAVPRRVYARAGQFLIGHGRPQVKVPGSVQSRATIPVPRRVRVRAGLFRIGIRPPFNAAGKVQPKATVAIPRRVKARGFWRWNAGHVLPAGKVQPRATMPVPRRVQSRAGFWRGVDALHIRPNGTVQSRATVPTPRRSSARSGLFRIGHGPAIIQGRLAELVPDHNQPRRTTARAVIRTTQIYTRQQLGKTPPRPIGLADPRRTAVRGKWQGVAGKRPLLGQAEPRDVTMQPRRTSTRGIWHGIAAPLPRRGVTPGSVTLVHRRTAERGTWQRLNGIRALAGRPQPRGNVAQPRRTRTRITWRSIAGSRPDLGVTQPRATVPLPRRVPARSRWASIRGLQPPRGVVQPQPTRQPRRTSTRAVWHALVTYTKPRQGRVQPEQTQPHRRGTARAVTRRQQSVFVITSSVDIAFNVYTSIESSVMIAFNIGGAQPTGERLIPGVPWISPVNGIKMIPNQPWTSPHDARRKLVEDNENPMQGDA